MAIVLTILRKAHARGTHHFLALDALAALRNSHARAWERLFYRYITLYMDGAKAPDTAFKDFENHVLHPRKGFWGGAATQAAVWYAETVEALKRQDFGAAAYAAGVMSHYVTDPFQPLHTHQTEAENAIHAAVEWSASRSYATLYALGDTLPRSAPAPAASIEVLLRTGAQRATAHYETTLAHYDIKRGVVTPEEGLDDVGRRVMAEMLVAAAETHALLLDRAIAEAGVTPPDVSLAGDALRAFVRLPVARRRARREDGEQRRLIEAMYDELMATGRVDATLPEDERKIRDLHAALERVEPIEAGVPMASTPSVVAVEVMPIVASATAPTPSDGATTTTAATALAAARPLQIEAPPTATVAPSLASYRPSARAARAALSSDADIVDAPSIGPKSAKRFNEVGIDTVGDFLKAHPIALAARLDFGPLSPLVLAEWQDQARLMCALGDLRAADAKLLVGAGYRTLDAITNVEPDQFSADILRFALSAQGLALLREGHAPDVERIRGWAAEARESRAA